MTVAQVLEAASPETLDVLLKALDRATEPLTARQLAGKLTGPFQQPPAELATVLEQMAEQGRVHRYPPYRGAARYWTRDLDSFTRGKILEALSKSKRPRTRAELKPPNGVSVDRWRKAIAWLLERGEVQEFPPLLASRMKRLSVRPLDPVDYVGPALDALCGKLVSAGVSEDDVLRTARRLVAERLRERTDAGTDERLRELILERMLAIEPAAERGALVAVRELRRSLEFQDVGHEVFDRVVLELGRQGRVALHRHDYSSSLTPEERDELVSDGRGNYYVGIALRSRTGEAT